MKKSNIFLISGVVFLVGWLVISDWMQANAYNIILSHKKCSYAQIVDNDSIKKLAPFKNINIVFETRPFYPKIIIRYTEKQELIYSNSMKKSKTFSISGDTLNIRINYDTWDPADCINIGVPVLKSINLSSNSEFGNGSYSDLAHNVSVSGFRTNVLKVLNNSPYDVKLYNNRIKKLELRGDFNDIGKVEISNYTDCDSLDVDVQSKRGTLILNQYSDVKENPKPWISIKVPASFHIEAPADALLVSKITIKK